MRITIIRNPIAGGGRNRLYDAVRALLLRKGAQLTERATRARGDAEALAAAVDPALCDRLVVAGGDGTMREVINGLAAIASPPPIGLIPLGTGNVLAAELGLPMKADIVADTILSGASVSVNVGTANGRRFLLMLGAGFDAQAVSGVNLALKLWIGKGAYVIAALGATLHGLPGPFRVIIDGTDYETRSVIVTNISHYGGPYLLTRRTSIRSDDFVVCLFSRMRAIDIMRYGLAGLMQGLDRTPGVEFVSGKRIRIDGPEGALVQADGDLAGFLPMTISTEPGAIRLQWPKCCG